MWSRLQFPPPPSPKHKERCLLIAEPARQLHVAKNLIRERTAGPAQQAEHQPKRFC